MARINLKNITVQDGPEARAALDILTAWRKSKECARHVVRAIRLYAALQSGDTGQFLTLLREFFPGVGINLGGAASVEGEWLKARIAVQAERQAVTIEQMVEQAGDEFGMEGMEF